VESLNFDRAAGYYDATRALPADTMAGLTAVLSAELAGRQPCLEIGVGTGRIALPLRERGIALAGTDISVAMLRKLVANAEGVPFPLMRADATRLPVAAGTFGSVLAVHVLHLIPQWRVAVDEALRVLRPGGALIASFGGGGSSGRQARDPAEAVPWREPVQEVLRRRGLVRIRRGATDADEVARYVSGRARPRPLPPVTVVETRTLRQSVDSLEAQILSWTWPYSQEQVRAAGSDIRAWAAREDFPLDREHTVRSELRWWAFDA
jgi:SAM-dependent methyltransferase